ncbi:MAG: hypothetical protein KKA28_19650 [Planctomycetes bacterium]|nr:hypothetical protein [Planctomycetota bacterium]
MPDEYYAFTDGQLSCTVERHGGINTLRCLDVLEKDGKLYPDRGATPVIFSKEGGICGKRPLYGPAVQFISTNTFSDGASGRNLFHVPDRLQLYPFGFTSESLRFGHRTTYDLAIIGRDVLFAFMNRFPTRANLVVNIGKSHIFQGDAYTLKHQLAEGGDNLDNPPFKENRTWKQKWGFIGFDPKCNGFVLEGAMKFAYGTKPVVVLFTADCPLAFSENESRYFLEAKWTERRKIHLCLTMAETRQGAVSQARKVFGGFENILSRKIKESISYSKKSTTLDAEDYPDIQKFSKTAPSFLKAMTLAETPREICIRAATHKYGFFNLWDQVWPAKAFMLMGDWETAKKLIRYPLSLLTAKEKKHEIIYLALFEILIAEDIIAISGDRQFEKEIYGELKRLFLAYLGRADLKNGFLSAGGACGVDDPKEIGIEGEVWPCCLNSFWYDACRAMENLALRRGDAETAGRAEKQWKLIQKNYLDVFYNPRNGYLYSSVNADSGKGILIYQHTAALGMDFAYGESLLHPRLKEIGGFQAYQLYHPAGRSGVAYWDTAHEMWKNCIMFQHLAHEMRTARAAGLGDEIARMMKVYLGHFHRNKVAIETHNLVGAEGDITQRSNWQAFGTRALYSGIVESLIGIQCDLGGFGYVLCDGSGEMAISNFKFRKGHWNIQINGDGQYVSKFAVDGRTLRGTMKVPAEYLGDGRSHTLQITRSRIPFKRPTLLAAPGAAIRGVTAEPGSLAFGVSIAAHPSVKFFSPLKPRIDINGRTVECYWNPEACVGWFDALMEPGMRVQITSKVIKKLRK